MAQTINDTLVFNQRSVPPAMQAAKPRKANGPAITRGSAAVMGDDAETPVLRFEAGA